MVFRDLGHEEHNEKTTKYWGERHLDPPPENHGLFVYICVTTPRHKRCPYRPLIRYKIGQMPTVTRGG